MPVLLDEKYLEFVRDDDFPDGIETYKDFGLAGLRVSFAVAHEPVAAPGPRSRSASRERRRARLPGRG